MGSVLVLSRESDGAPIAHRLSTEGSIVKLCFDNQEYNNILLGMKNPSIVTSLRLLEQYDLIIDTGTKSSDLVITEGYTPIAGGSFGRRLNEDTEYMMKVLKLCGVSTESPPKATSSIQFLVTGWFNGESYSFYTRSHSFNHLCEGEKGRRVEGMGRVTTVYKGCLQKYFHPLVVLLKKLKYLGPVTIKFSMKDSEVVGESITTTFLPIEVFELYKSKAFELLWDLKSQNTIQLKEEYSVLSRLVIDSPNGEKLLNVEKEAFPHVCFQDMKSDGCSSLSGPTLCFVTARSPQLFEARRRVIRTIKKIVNSPLIQYRSDIGYDSELMIQHLTEWEARNADR